MEDMNWILETGIVVVPNKTMDVGVKADPVIVTTVPACPIFGDIASTVNKLNSNFTDLVSLFAIMGFENIVLDINNIAKVKITLLMFILFIMSSL